MNDEIKSIWVVSIGMLLLSFFHWPYGYYTLLRIVVTGCAGYLTYREYSQTNSVSLFTILMAFLTILFNPIIPIYFPRSVWFGLDLIAALVLGLHGILVHIRYQSSK